jgi:hypothetical protein
MTFVIKTRGAGGLLVADYRCPEHGMFEAVVQRNELGDAPDELPCPVVVHEQAPHACGYDYEHDETIYFYEDVLCCEPSPWTISAPKSRVVSVVPTAAVRGGDMTDRPPGMLDTRDLAEGKVTHTQWKAKQRELTRARRHEQLIAKGVKQRKIQVG